MASISSLDLVKINSNELLSFMTLTLIYQRRGKLTRVTYTACSLGFLFILNCLNKSRIQLS